MEGKIVERIFLLILALATVSFAINISDCTNLTTENATYTLTANVVQGVPTSACFEFQANNITLDCAGYSTTLNGTGIRIDSVNYASVKNCVFPQYSPCFGCALEVFSINVTDASNVVINTSVGSCISFNKVNNATLTYSNVSDQNCRLTGHSQYAISINQSNNSLISNNRIFSVQTGVGVPNNYSLLIDNLSYSNQIFNNYFKLDWVDGTWGIWGPQVGCLGGDDSGLGNLYIKFDDNPQATYFNTTRQVGTRIYSTGTEIGGNFYERTGCSAFGMPDAGGLSNICIDTNKDGFCDSVFGLAGTANICTGTPFCAFPNSTVCTDSIFNPICNWGGTACEGTCSDCPSLSFDMGTCLSQLGCSWNGTGCEGTCQDCTTFTNTISCNAQLGCAFTGSANCHIAPTCGVLGDENCSCGDLLTQPECQNQTGCSWTLNTTQLDYLPLSNKYSISSGGGGSLPTCPQGQSLCKDGSCQVDCNPQTPPRPDIIQQIHDIEIFGIRLTIWLLLLAIVIMTFDYEVIGKGKRFSVLGLSGFFLFTFAVVVELIPLLSGAGTL